MTGGLRGGPPPEDKASRFMPRRRKLWQIEGGLQCSIIGTCLAHKDLTRIARKCGVRVQAEATPYDIHGHVVQEVLKPGAIARAVQKLLDRRYAGIIHKVDGCRTEAERAALWQAEYDAGRIPGAYWAFLSHNLVGTALLKRIFGEIHMLSHLLGRLTHRGASQASELQARLDHLESKLARLSSKNQTLTMQRDKVPADQAIALRAGRAGQAAADRGAAGMPCGREADLLLRFERKERALIAARERARGAEQEVRRLTDRLARLAVLSERRERGTLPPCPGADACVEAVRSDISRRVLYVGGRTGMIQQLKRVAERAGADFIHHDGGEQQAVTRIDGLIEACDAVFCPIDCVSHTACLRAKALCRKFSKPFVPLRSSGAASFERALSALPAH
jgi:hypothetical protein